MARRKGLGDPGSGPVPAWLGRPLEGVYARAVARRNRKWDDGVGVTRLPVPVVSVGNLSVGGTGKTPMVVHVTRTLLAAGRRPCVAMRGYMRSFRLSGAAPGETVRSDEARMYAELLPGVPVVAQPDRIAGVRGLLERGVMVDCVVLDDGFQHRRLARDLDIVLIDASRSPFEDRLLPAGWLREPAGSLRRAGAVVITHAEMVGEDRLRAIEMSVRETNPGAMVATARHEWTGLLVARPGAGADVTEPVEWLAGQRAVGVCAIGNPAGFLRGVVETGTELVGEVVLPDHDPYRAWTVNRIMETVRLRRAGVIVTTEKDWAKLREVPMWPCPVARAQLEMAFVEGEGALDALVVGAVGPTSARIGPPGDAESACVRR
ncbi:MAG: tetraacyldisaccharide 4'-kinase [Phycisphaeraceae bacterium]|nr:tetraacyldisaccharide 4'-kinase [Phycisphaeraceae bacterium]